MRSPIDTRAPANRIVGPWAEIPSSPVTTEAVSRMDAQARFSVGQLVYHLKFDYRGVIVDVDAEFQGSEEWYRQVALSRPPKDKPWYRVLVDGADHMTYVAERHLEADTSCKPITHPELDKLFNNFKNCTYQVRRRNN